MFFTHPSFLMKMRKISVFHWHVLEVLIFVGSFRLRQLDVFCKNLFQICANIQCIPVRIHWCTNAYHIQPITIFTITPSLILDKFIFLYTFLWTSFQMCAMVLPSYKFIDSPITIFTITPSLILDEFIFVSSTNFLLLPGLPRFFRLIGGSCY